MLIDMAPFPNGSIPAAQSEAAATLGAYVRGCYGAPPVATMGRNQSANMTGYTYTIRPNSTSDGDADGRGGGESGSNNVVDRVQIREDQRNGQLIRGFKLTAVVIPNDGAEDGGGDTTRTTRTGENGSRDGRNGGIVAHTTVILCPTRATSVGNKYICVLPAPLRVASITLQVTAAEGGMPAITQFDAFMCSDLIAALDRDVAEA